MKRPPAKSVEVPPDDDPQASQLERLASVFADQLRDGRPASIEQYAEAHPALADEIRELFPVILAMEVSKRDRDAPAMRREIPQEMSFDRLGGCRLVREIGRGGMGVVFEARRGTNDERVAVKWFPWRMAAMSHWRERFEHEAKTVETLKHPNIVPLLGTGEGGAGPDDRDRRERDRRVGDCGQRDHLHEDRRRRIDQLRVCGRRARRPAGKVDPAVHDFDR